MTTVFADTYYYLALLNPRDAAHERAVRVSQELVAGQLTTAWILTELGDALSAPNRRGAFAVLLDSVSRDPNVVVLPPTSDLFDQGVNLFRQRLDKDWTLTDSISFEAMREHGIQDVLTGDRHFTQAGFTVLL